MILSLDLQAFQTRIASQGDVYDLEAGVIQFASNIVHGAESAGSAMISLMRTSPASTASVSYYASGGLASADVDYATISGTVYFAEGSTQEMITVQIFADDLGEGPEWFYLYLSDFAGAIPGDPVVTTVVIDDREAAVIMHEDFSSGLPAGWVITANEDTNALWRFDNPGLRSNNTGGSGAMAIVDSDWFYRASVDTELITPVLSFLGMASGYLMFNTDFYHNSAEYADVDLSLHGPSGPWQNLWSKHRTDYRGPARVRLWLPGVAGHTNVAVRFHYYDAYYDWWWQVDDVMIIGEPDADQDSLPDWWELDYGNMDPDGDEDDDDATNYEEFLAGSDPLDDQSYLMLLSLQKLSEDSTNLLIRWSSEANRIYRIDGSTNLCEEFPELIHAEIPATPPVNSITNLFYSSSPHFLRIGVRPE